MIGQTISHYRILEELGRGGMGVVYKAEDTTLKRTVALKFLSPHLLADEKQKKRFLHEAQAAAALDHPNISTIHEIHEADGQTFMVMAFIEGEDVGSKIQKGPMDITEALDIAVQVARGLARAHGEGIVHRDIKPGNVIITPEGQAKVVDFGLAKLATQTALTKTGATVGTVRYMSPEQATRGDTDHRTDIWSLGVMLYEMLSGQLPFRGEVEQAIMYSVLNEDPQPVTEWRADVPVALEDIVERALAKDPQKRYDTMAEFLTALETQRDQITLGIKEREFRGLRKLRRRKRLTAGVAAVLVVAIAAILAQTFYTRSMAIDSVAVLPFANLSGDDEQEYFSDGMTEQLINEVGQIGALRVISRTSVMQFKETEKTLPEIAAELHVDAVIEASVMRDGDQVRITAQLIRANPEEVLWSESYNRDAQDVLSLLSEVAREIADRIEVAVTASERERLTRARPVDPDAHDAYLKGLYYSKVWTAEGFGKSMQYYMEAIELDPTYAEPYAGLAALYSSLGLWGILSTEEAEPKARAAAQKAIELDPSLGAGYTALAGIKLMYDWDWYGPDADLRRALELSPNDPEVHSGYDGYLTLMGRHDEAIAHSKKAIELDPLTSSRTAHLAWVYHYAGEYDKSIEISRKLDDQLQLAWAYTEKGMYAEAVAALDSARAKSEDPKNQVLLSQAGYYYARSGREDKAREMLNGLLTLSETAHVDPGHIAFVYSGLGETDKMFEWLEKGYETRSFYMIFLPGDFGEYHDDPRYIDLCQRIGIPLDE